MNVLFCHPNFPAQFRGPAGLLGKDPANNVVFVTKTPRPDWEIPGVSKSVYTFKDEPKTELGPVSGHYDVCTRHGQAVLRHCRTLQDQGFRPDVMVAHSGWGQSMYLRDAFPGVPLVSYFEWYYHDRSPDVLFTNSHPPLGKRVLLRSKSTPILHDLASCSVGISPTAWQKYQFPSEFQHKIVQLHDGVDTEYMAPLPEGRPLPPALQLPVTGFSDGDELLTYVARGLEPYRGFPVFYAALPAVLKARPGCRVLIVGSDRVCYGAPPRDGRNYRQIMQEKVKVDPERVRFTGSLSYGAYRAVLQASSVHAYLTWPFVLSWSMLEAMSCGCLLVGSNTPPVRELIRHDENGLLTDMRSPEKVAQSLIHALERNSELEHLRTAARKTILDNYDSTRCLAANQRLLQCAAAGDFEPGNPARLSNLASFRI